MISLRLREWGSAEWTEGRIIGDLEESVAEALISALSEDEERELHIQVRRDADEAWRELSEFDFLPEGDA